MPGRLRAQVKSKKILFRGRNCIVDEDHVMWPFTEANGLCSTMVVFSHDIVRVAKWCAENNLPCPRVDWSNTFGVYGENTYNKLFKPNHEIPVETYAEFGVPRIMYAGEDTIIPEEIAVMRQIAKDWFEPTDEIIRIKNQFKKQYNFDPEKGVCAYYRGADKVKEMCLPSYASYVAPLRNIKRKHPDITDILIQSDELSFQSLIKRKAPFKNNVVIEQLNENLDQVDHGTGCHFIGTPEFRETHVKQFYAALLLMAECKHIIMLMTNADRWICALNDSKRNIIQVAVNLNLKFINI